MISLCVNPAMVDKNIQFSVNFDIRHQEIMNVKVINSGKVINIFPKRTEIKHKVMLEISQIKFPKSSKKDPPIAASYKISASFNL